MSALGEEAVEAPKSVAAPTTVAEPPGEPGTVEQQPPLSTFFSLQSTFNPSALPSLRQRPKLPKNATLPRPSDTRELRDANKAIAMRIFERLEDISRPYDVSLALVNCFGSARHFFHHMIQKT